MDNCNDNLNYLNNIEDILFPENQKEVDEIEKNKKEKKEQRKAEYMKNHPEQFKVPTEEYIKAKKKQKLYKKRQNKNKKVYNIVKDMTHDERVKFYDELYKEKELKKEIEKEGVKKGYDSNFIICFDLDYNNCMDIREKKSLAHQLSLCYCLNKHNKNKISFYLTGDIQELKNELNKINADKWYIHSMEKPFYLIDELIKLKKEFIYLSPDAEENLEDVSDDKIYIIGGLVDRQVIKNRSMIRYSNIKNGDDNEIKIVAKKLPLQKYAENINNPILNVNTVVEILSFYMDMEKEKKDWKIAIESIIPKRKLENK